MHRTAPNWSGESGPDWSFTCASRAALLSLRPLRDLFRGLSAEGLMTDQQSEAPVKLSPTEKPPSSSSASNVAGLHRRIMSIQSRIKRATARTDRPSNTVRILLATKTQNAETVQLAYEALIDLGIHPPRFGENRSREGREKAAEINLSDAIWSMIGHVQGNKIDDVIAFASEIQSLDRMSLALALDDRLQHLGRSMDVLVQVKTSNENSKFGLPASDVPAFLRDLKHLASLRVRGFMTLATNTSDSNEIRRCFQVLREVRERARQESLQADSLEELSMGMSGDFELAIEEGATCVRIGEAVFGKRSFRPPGGWWSERAR